MGRYVEVNELNHSAALGFEDLEGTPLVVVHVGSQLVLGLVEALSHVATV